MSHRDSKDGAFRLLKEAFAGENQEEILARAKVFRKKNIRNKWFMRGILTTIVFATFLNPIQIVWKNTMPIIWKNTNNAFELVSRQNQHYTQLGFLKKSLDKVGGPTKVY